MVFASSAFFHSHSANSIEFPIIFWSCMRVFFDMSPVLDHNITLRSVILKKSMETFLIVRLNSIPKLNFVDGSLILHRYPLKTPSLINNIAWYEFIDRNHSIINQLVRTIHRGSIRGDPLLTHENPLTPGRWYRRFMKKNRMDIRLLPKFSW